MRFSSANKLSLERREEGGDERKQVLGRWEKNKGSQLVDWSTGRWIGGGWQGAHHNTV